MKKRLQKIIAEAGICSRRKAEELIKKGEVTINGKVAKLGDKADPDKDEIRVKGKLIKFPEKVYIMLNKPSGYVSTTKGQFGQKTVMELLKGLKIRVFPVGRLDVDTEGLLLLTNDGDFANRVMHPRYGIKKTYFVVLNGELSEKDVKKLKSGIIIDGKRVQIDSIEKKGKHKYRLVIHEGMKRIVKRLFEAIEFRVRYLYRDKIGNLSVGRLPKGKWRKLTERELMLIFSEDFSNSSKKS
ncbi:MAG: rRNA pseudouridine synthase [Candidatus Aminicenantes bacterium]|nr:rRNA pseudouridine synthase [Candidatus Aminicenantes bacterium]